MLWGLLIVVNQTVWRTVIGMGDEPITVPDRRKVPLDSQTSKLLRTSWGYLSLKWRILWSSMELMTCFQQTHREVARTTARADSTVRRKM
jgi:hypothetical protein